MKKLYLSFVLAAVTLLAPSCGEDDPKPSTATTQVETNLDVEMLSFTNTSAYVTIGLASTEAKATAQNGDVWTGQVTYAETKTSTGNKEKNFKIPARAAGEKLWLFAKCVNPNNGAAAQLHWRKKPMVTYSVSTVLVKEVEIGE